MEVLAERSSDNTHVELVKDYEVMYVIVNRQGRQFTLNAGKDGKLALDMFYHPFVYGKEEPFNVSTGT